MIIKTATWNKKTKTGNIKGIIRLKLIKKRAYKYAYTNVILLHRYTQYQFHMLSLILSLIK